MDREWLWHGTVYGGGRVMAGSFRLGEDGQGELSSITTSSQELSSLCNIIIKRRLIPTRNIQKKKKTNEVSGP